MGHPDGAHTHGSDSGGSGAALAPWQPGILRPAQRPAVVPREVHLHLHNVSPDDVAQALSQLPTTAAQPPGWASRIHPANWKDHP